MATAIDQLDLMELPIEDRAFGADPEPWFAQARQKHPWLAKFSHGYLVHGHHEIRDLISMDDKFQLAVGDVVEYDGPLDVDRIADDVVARIKADADFAARIAAELQGGGSIG